MAVNPPAVESDLRPVEEGELSRAIEAPFTYARSLADLSKKSAEGAVREVGVEALYLVMALLLAETWLAMRFGSNR